MLRITSTVARLKQTRFKLKSLLAFITLACFILAASRHVRRSATNRASTVGSECSFQILPRRSGEQVLKLHSIHYQQLAGENDSVYYRASLEVVDHDHDAIPVERWITRMPQNGGRVEVQVKQVTGSGAQKAISGFDLICDVNGKRHRTPIIGDRLLGGMQFYPPAFDGESAVYVRYFTAVGLTVFAHDVCVEEIKPGD